MCMCVCVCMCVYVHVCVCVCVCVCVSGVRELGNSWLDEKKLTSELSKYYFTKVENGTHSKQQFCRYSFSSHLLSQVKCTKSRCVPLSTLFP